MNPMQWDPLGLLGEGGAAVGGGILLGPLGLLGGLLGGGGSGSGSGSSGGGDPVGGYQQQQPNIIGQIMPLVMLALVVYLALKYLPKLIK